MTSNLHKKEFSHKWEPSISRDGRTKFFCSRCDEFFIHNYRIEPDIRKDLDKMPGVSIICPGLDPEEKELLNTN